MFLYIMRHAESYSNTGGKVISTTDLPITEKGRLQAEQARIFLTEALCGQGGKFSRVFSSPLLRAKQTAEIACGAGTDSGLADEIDIVPELTEMNLGAMEGMTWKERFAKYPDIDIAAKLSEAVVPEGESFADVTARCERFLKEKLANLPDLQDNILVVTHGITKRVLINTILRKPKEKVDSLNWADNTALSIIEYNAQTGAAVPVHINRREHLTASGLGAADFDIWGEFSDTTYL